MSTSGEFHYRIPHRLGAWRPGSHPATTLGAGQEFVSHMNLYDRPDPRRLDLRASLRDVRGEWLIRVNRQRAAVPVQVIVDVSASMAFGSAARLKSDVAEGIALVVGRLAVRRGGRLSLLGFGAPDERFLPPRSGRGALVGLRRALGEGVATDGHASEDGLSRAARRISRLSRQPGLVTVVSDFREPAASWTRAVGSLAARHSVLAVEVRDPREGTLPDAGRLSLVDPETGRRVEADTASGRLRERFAAGERARQEAVADALRHARAAHTIASTDGDWLRDLGRGL